jgi:predicted metal-binding membrane protein
VTSELRTDSMVEHLLRRDRLVVFVGLFLLTTLAWTYLYYLTTQMHMGGNSLTAPVGMGSSTGVSGGAYPNAGMVMSDMVKLAPWTVIDALFMFLMWAVMMVGMMAPSATPVILLYARVVRHNAKESEPLVHTAAFFTGYVIVWTVFSAVATAMQFGLEQAALLSPMMTSMSPVFGGLVLLGVAVYQWTPYKDACLRRCRSPVWFLSTYWQDGANGALRMGLAHGTYCLGCCWALMFILFVGGVMNLLCIAAITVFVLAEKVLPRGREFGRAGAVLLGLAGITLIAG